MRSIERLIEKKMKRFPLEIGIIQSVNSSGINVFIPLLRKQVQCSIPSFMKQQILIPQFSISAELPAEDVYIDRYDLTSLVGHRVVIVNPRTHPQISAMWEV